MDNPSRLDRVQPREAKHVQRWCNSTADADYLTALAACCLSRVDETLRYGRLAVNLNGDDPRLRDKLATYGEMAAAIATVQPEM